MKRGTVYPETDTAQTGPHLLLVEDGRVEAVAAHRAFIESRLWGELHIVFDGLEALAFLQGSAPFINKPRPNVVLLNVDLPRMDGWELLAEIRSDRSFRELPVLMYSREMDQQTASLAIERGANEYFRKPHDIASYGATLRAVCARWCPLPDRATPPASQGLAT